MDPRVIVVLTTMDKKVLETFVINPAEPMTPGAIAEAVKEMVRDYWPIEEREA